MAMKQEFMTKKGYKELEKKLENLKVVRRKDVAEKIKIAREFGDISENAEYDAAKEEQAQIEGEIMEIEQKLRTASIINEESEGRTSVDMGSKVKVYDVEFDEEVEYTIVGTTEADPVKNKISNEAPIGKALLGRSVGDEVEVTTPGGMVKLKVVDIN